MNLYIIRHGETDWNKTRRMQGRTDIPLNEFGIHLAEETAKGLRDTKFAAVYTSPLGRAVQTAQIVAGKDAVLIKDERLTEMGFGVYEGLSTGKDTWNVPDEDFQKFFTEPEGYEPPEGGEAFGEVAARIRDFLTELAKEEAYADKNVLISTHGATCCTMLNTVIKGKPVSSQWDGGVPKNCAVTIVEERGGKYSVLRENHVYYKDEVKPW